ncbi:zinc ribbon domain-containing protein [Streptosporangiaceae bacterium NEAU-GS5]|nr:zinc ribbon domain-containing protein [Streptosporangiaceae bacterium NEAU-GS5]
MNCPSCGTANPVGTQFCQNCGAYLTWEHEQEQQPQTFIRPQAQQQAGMRMELDTAEVSADPGGNARAQVTVFNTGTRVEQFRVSITGTAARWATVTPSEMTVYPGNSAAATVTFAPPRSPAGPAGTWDFAVEAASTVSGLHEARPGRLTIGRFQALSAALVPPATRGGERTQHVLALENQGNAAEDVWLTAADSEGELRIGLPAQVRLRPGKTEVPVDVAATPATFGLPKRVTFQVVVTPGGERPITVDGTRVVVPRFGRWPLIVAPVAVAALVAIAMVALSRSGGDAAAPPAAAGQGEQSAGATPSAKGKPSKKPGAKNTPKSTPKRPQPVYFSGKTALRGGAAEVSVPSLPQDAHIFLTPDLTAISGAGVQVADGVHTGSGFPAAALRVTARADASFRVEPISGTPPEDLRFSWLVVDKPSGSIGALPFQAGTGRIPGGEKRVDVSGVQGVGPQSVIILTVGGGSQDVRVDRKADGVFTVATADGVPAASDVEFDYLVVDPSGGGDGPDKAAAGFGETTNGQVGVDGPRLENGLISATAAVLLTTDSTAFQDDPGSADAAFAGVCVVNQGSGFATVEPFFVQRPNVKTPYDWLVVT